MKRQDPLHLAAIFCEHIAGSAQPIRSAFKTAPIESEDSGWQFFCGGFQNEDPEKAKIWLVKEVLEIEPSLSNFLDVPIGTKLWRQSSQEVWQVESIDDQ